MGRPSLVAERREQILEAFSRCLAEHGLEGTTLDAIAAEAGVQRAAIRHYVGNRDELIRQGVQFIAAQYAGSIEEELTPQPGVARLNSLLDSMFIGDIMEGHPLEDRVIEVLFAAAGSDEQIRKSLYGLYSGYERRLVREISAAYPDADPQRITGIAFAIMCMAEQCASMEWLGFPRERVPAAREAAGALIRSL